MKYQYSFLPEAQQEYEQSLIWYLERSTKAAENFVLGVNQTLELICKHPLRWRNFYKNYYELSVRKYPFSIIYSIEKEKSLIIITAIFHHKRNPKKKYPLK